LILRTASAAAGVGAAEEALLALMGVPEVTEVSQVVVVVVVALPLPGFFRVARVRGVLAPYK
jgi:hypothetical protein